MCEFLPLQITTRIVRKCSVYIRTFATRDPCAELRLLTLLPPSHNGIFFVKLQGVTDYPIQEVAVVKLLAENDIQIHSVLHEPSGSVEI